MDLPVLAFGCSVLALAAVLGYLGRSYRPEPSPLIPARPVSFGIAARSVAVGGALVAALGAFGFGGALVVGITLVAVAVARIPSSAWESDSSSL